MAYHLLYVLPFLLLQAGGKDVIAPLAIYVVYMVSRMTHVSERIGKILILLHILACFAMAFKTGDISFALPVVILPHFLYHTADEMDDGLMKKVSAIIIIGAMAFAGKKILAGGDPFSQASALSVALFGLFCALISNDRKKPSGASVSELQQSNKDLQKQVKTLAAKLSEASKEGRMSEYMSVILGLEFTGFSEEENIEMTLNTIKKALRPVFCGYYAVDESMRSFVLTQSLGSCTAFGKREDFGIGFIGETYKTQHLSTLTNLQKTTEDVFQRQQLNGVNFALAFPVVVKNKVCGAFALGMSAMDEKEEQTIASLCSIISNKINIEFDKILDHKQMTEKSITDKLTGLYNRLYFEEVFPAEFQRAQHEGRSIAYMLIDLDYFKQMNDTHGHDFGDKVLKIAARTFRENIRKSDYAFRTGGDEFSIVLMEATPDAARHVATKIAKEYEKKVEKEHLYAKKDGKDVRSSFSIGIAVYPNAPVDSAADLVKKADSAVYYVKEHGKNNIAVAGGK